MAQTAPSLFPGEQPDPLGTLPAFDADEGIAGRREDRYRALAMAQAAAADGSGLHVVVHPGEPAVKARARVVNGHAYTPAKTKAAQAALAQRLAYVPRFTGNVAVSCVFTRGNRQRVDVDNLLKLVLDAGTQAMLWEDDSQVTALSGVIELDADDPRTVVAFAEHRSTMARGPDSLRQCQACGNRFDPYGRDNQVHCSVACRMTCAEPVPCPTCGKPFKRRHVRAKYCSVECRGLAQRVARPCAGCGRNRARRESTYCRECWASESRVVEAVVLGVLADGPVKLESIWTAHPEVPRAAIQHSVRALTDAGVLRRVRRGWYERTDQQILPVS
jgi:Holliday junction resolvase RusA-like endonuclease